MSNRTKADAAKNLILVPLNKLKKSPKNVRKVPHTKADIEALAASIAALGMLQFPVVEEERDGKGKPTGHYLVNAGEGRRLAELLRAKRKDIKADEPIRCILDREHNATEISLAENAIRADMHPADQYEAFAKLHDEDGFGAEDIAARFGVTAHVVKQRLKLGAVSPKLMALYRKGGMSLDQLTAFAITDDHARQERVWNDLPRFHRTRPGILQALSEGQVRSDDRRALFVGSDAYEAAGGTMIRDLFDAEGGGYFADAALLDRLVGAKLEAAGAKVTAEGWRWVTVAVEFDHGAASGMRRVFPEPVPRTPTERKRLRKLKGRYDALCDKYPDGDLPAADQAKLARIEASIDALNKYAYRARDLALAGAFVALAHDGSVRVERGYVRPEHEPKAKPKAKGKAGAEPDAPAGLSEKLVAELTAHRTMALRNELAKRPNMALIALTHRLALDSFYHATELSCLEVQARSAFLQTYAPGIEASIAGREIAGRHEAWGKRLPREADQLWAFIRDMAADDRLALLAHCASLGIDAVRVRNAQDTSLAHADALAAELKLDMAAYWQPTSGGYFARVSKERILDALREGGVSDTGAIARLKKSAMADAAEAALLGKGWLPAILRPHQSA
jgi:ParB family transcriptional regulator, chromosome partitioning protein